MSSPLSTARPGRQEAPSLDEARPLLHPDRLLPSRARGTRAIARRLYESVQRPADPFAARPYRSALVCAKTSPFPIPATLFVKPDHYVTRMLYSQGVTLEELGIARRDGKPVESRSAPGLAALRRALSPLSRHADARSGSTMRFATLFGFDERLCGKNADACFDQIARALWRRRDFRPRALFERFNIEAIATTESPLDDLRWHKMIRESGWSGRVITAYRPDPVVDPEFDGFAANLERFGEIAGEDVGSFEGYLDAASQAPRLLRRDGRDLDRPRPPERANGRSSARRGASALRQACATAERAPAEAEMFRAQMLTEMAAMSLDDGLVMQLHPGSLRNHNPLLHAGFGRDIGRRHSDTDRICARR